MAHPGSTPLKVQRTYFELQESVINCELLVLRHLSFQLEIEYPHKYLLHFMLALEPDLPAAHTALGDTCREVTQAAWVLLFDAYLEPSWLDYDARQFALACIHTAAAMLGVELPVHAPPTWWIIFMPLSSQEMAATVQSLLGTYRSGR